LQTGLQRQGCLRNHDCGRDRWSGSWPGEDDCRALGFVLPSGFPDLNRLYAQAFWDPASRRWSTPENTSDG
jgi:hypothetical protein